MAKITDKSLLNQNIEVTFDTVNQIVALNVSGNLDDIGPGASNGVTFQSLYSFTKQEWRIDSELIKYPFPILAITPNQFEMQEDWDFSGSDWTGSNFKGRLVRDGGWARRDSGGTIREEYMNIATLGTFVTNSDQAYYQQSGSLAKVDFLFAGPVNEAVKIYGDAGNGNFDYRDYFKTFLRERGKTFSFGDLIVDQELSALTFIKYALPLSNTTDIKITATDNTITGSAPYTSVDIYYQSGSGFTTLTSGSAYPSGSVVQDSTGRWFYTIAGGTSDNDAAASDTGVTWTAYSGERDIGGTYYAYNVFIEAANLADAEEVYEKVQYLLRTGSDIDTGDGIVIGNTADELLNFIGDTLRTTDGVYIDNFLATDTNRLEFTDISGSVRTFPFVAAGTINFNINLQQDPSASYWMFFTNAGGNQYGTTNAIIVNNNSGAGISGSVATSASVSFDFDYDNNEQGGRTSGSDAPITVVAIGLATAQFVSATSNIERSVSNSVTLVSNLERNFL